jgi:hypothetical protein
MIDSACLRAVMLAWPTLIRTAELERLLWRRPAIGWWWHSPPRITVPEAGLCVHWQHLYRRHLHHQPVTADGRMRYLNINFFSKVCAYKDILWKRGYFWETYCNIASIIILFCICVTYKACSKKDRTFAIKTLLFTLQHFKLCLLQSTSLY